MLLPRAIKYRHGFSLIELMVAVAIIAILAAVCYPSYIRYVNRSHQSAAQQFMMDVANRQEQYRLDTRTYASTFTDVGTSPSTDLAKYYTITLQGVSSMAFTIQAVPAGTQTGSTLTLNQLGDKTPVSDWNG